MRGLAYIRGKTIANLDLSIAMGGRRRKSEGAGFIVIPEYNKCVQGFLVNAVERIVILNWEHVHSPPKGSGRECKSGAVASR